MGTVRFVTTNLVETNGVLKNGTGGGAPARDEVSPYLMENALQHDRRVLWQQSSGNAMQVDLDLGANRNIAIAGLHGHRPLGPTGIGISSCVVQYATAAGGYPPAGWTTVGTMAFVPRDAISLFNQVSGRYWRFDLDGVFDAFTLGKLLLGVVNQDLGLNPSRQTERIRVPNVVDRTAGEDPIVTLTGDVRRLFTLHFRNITSTVLSKILVAAVPGQSFILIDRNDSPWEVIVADAEVEYELTFDSGAPLYDCDMHVEQLG